MSEARGLNRLWRSAVAASLVKGVLCGVVARVAIAYAYSLDGYGAMPGVMLLVYSQALLAVVVGYQLAARGSRFSLITR